MRVKPRTSGFILAGPPYGTLHALELKRDGSKPTKDQEAFGVAAAGGRGAPVTRTPCEFCSNGRFAHTHQGAVDVWQSTG